MDPHVLRPYPTYSTLRASGGVLWTGRTWLVTRFAEADIALVHNDLSAKRVELLFPNEAVPDNATPLANILRKWIFFNNPGDLKNDRKLVWDLLGPRKFDTLQSLLSTAMTDLIARWDPESIDLLTQLAIPIRIAITSHMLDLPQNRTMDLIRLADPVFDFITASTATVDQMNLAVTSMGHLYHSLADIPLIKSHSLSGPQLFSAISQLSLLVTVTVFIEKAIANCLYVLLSDTTRSKALASEPDQLALYIHEALRLESPTQITSRIAQSDLTLGGQMIKKGQTVAIIIGSANRDEINFKNPTRFDPHRSPNRTLTFGSGGKRCPGEWLSNTVVASALRAIIIAEHPMLKNGVLSSQWTDNLESRRLSQLMVTF